MDTTVVHGRHQLFCLGADERANVGADKRDGGKRPEPAQVRVKLTLPYTSVRLTQNIRFNEHLSNFLFPPLSTIKLLTGFRESTSVLHSTAVVTF